MLPKGDHQPAALAQRDSVPRIPLLVRKDLLTPPFRIVLRRDEVLRTSVPEASIDEHDHLRGAKHQIRSHAQVWLWTSVHCVSQSCRVDSGAHCQFWLRVTHTLISETSPHVLVARLWHEASLAPTVRADR